MKTALERMREAKITATLLVAEPSGLKDRIAGMTIRQFATAGLVLPIYSELLGKQVWFVSENAVIETDSKGLYCGYAVYRASELRELKLSSCESIETVQAIKETFGGVVEPDERI